MKEKKGEGKTKRSKGRGKGHVPKPTNKRTPVATSRQKPKEAASKSQIPKLCSGVHRNECDTAGHKGNQALIHSSFFFCRNQGEGRGITGQKRPEDEEVSEARRVGLGLASSAAADDGAGVAPHSVGVTAPSIPSKRSRGFKPGRVSTQKRKS